MTGLSRFYARAASSIVVWHIKYAPLATAMIWNGVVQALIDAVRSEGRMQEHGPNQEPEPEPQHQEPEPEPQHQEPEPEPQHQEPEPAPAPEQDLKDDGLSMVIVDLGLEGSPRRGLKPDRRVRH